jgi:RimJ/RimL family protein N-acetyltransferase
MTVIAGRRCRLRPLSRSDLSHSLKWRNDPAVRDAVLGYRFPVTEKMEEGWYDRVLADQGGKRATFAIEDLDGALAGLVHLFDIDWPCRLAHFGIVIGESSRQGRGIGSEATALMMAYGFDTLNLERIELRVVDSNVRARHIYAKLGFADEGRLRRAAFIAGAPADVIVMGLLREEFRRPAG